MIDRRELCGWQIASELPLPELPAIRAPLLAAPDLIITIGEVPEALPNPSFKGPLMQVGANGDSRIAIPGGTTFLIDREGRHVTISPSPSHPPAAIRSFLLGSVLAVICLRRGVVPLHACCIRVPTARGDAAIAFSATSGTGKSSLASAFLQRGYSILADDLTVLSLRSDQGVEALPTFPRVKLWRDAMLQFRYAPEDCERVRDDMDKFAVPVDEHFCATSLPLIGLYHYARVDDERHARLEQARGIERSVRFLEAVYQYKILFCAAAPDQAAYTAALSRMAHAIPKHWVVRQPSGIDRLDELITRVVNQLQTVAVP